MRLFYKKELLQVSLASVFIAAAEPSYSLDLLDQPDNRQFSLQTYLEAYYVEPSQSLAKNQLPDAVYSYQDTESPSINLALLNSSYSSDNFRANFGLASGSYMRRNYANETGLLNNLFQANIGLSLSSNNDIWLDVGLMPSHIGFESAIGNNNWTLSRSIMADNSPYYETGAKVSYTSADKRLVVSGLLLNGWQKIRREHDNSSLSIGHQLTYKPNQKITLNSSSFIGNDKPDETRQMRYFHNFYAVTELSAQWQLMLGLDIGAEQKLKGSQSYNLWYAPIAMLRYEYSPEIKAAARLEYYADPNNVIVQNSLSNNYKTFGYSFNLDYQLDNSLLCRFELKRLDSTNDDFIKSNGRKTDQNTLFTSALIINF